MMAAFAQMRQQMRQLMQGGIPGTAAARSMRGAVTGSVLYMDILRGC